ncbi:c-type cytochrome [Burkholderia orbicola]|uniref:Cytochrome c n=1 Tax=Burkholderia orbicola TaxID=2978683 RepID=A0ABT8NYC4_9BURK|nr:cytochrome c [Burkholderia orbicola]MDN7526357.1 cytochrome c [Burkholderia orbicola]
MNRQSLRLALMWAVPIVIGVTLAAAWIPEKDFDWRRHPERRVKIPSVDVTLPVSAERFPPGRGSDIANAQCLICHSTGMVTRQPPLTEKEWATISNKMRLSYGAPLPADQVDSLAKYLYSINGRKSDGASSQPSIVDMQGS